MKVEVDLEDLETIVFATAVIKNIETQLASRIEDPFVKPHLDYSKAHNNLVTVLNSAKRSQADTKTPWDEKLDKKEIDLLKEFGKVSVFEVAGDFRMGQSEVDSLAAKGCLHIGQLVAGAAADAEIAKLVGVNNAFGSAGLGLNGVLPSRIGETVQAGTPYIPHHQRIINAADYIKLVGLPEVLKFELRDQAKYVHSFDPDIACKKSWSMSVKIMTQQQRNYNRAYTEERMAATEVTSS